MCALVHQLPPAGTRKHDSVPDARVALPSFSPSETFVARVEAVPLDIPRQSHLDHQKVAYLPDQVEEHRHTDQPHGTVLLV